MSRQSLSRRIPFDLVAAVCLTALAAALVLGVDPGVSMANAPGASPGALAVRFATVGLGLAFLLFLPGYVVVSALFPAHEPAVEQLDAEGEPMAPRFQFRSRTGIDALERVTLAVGVSAVVTPMVALALNFAPWGIRVGPLVVAVAGITILGSVVAAVRRWRLPPEERFAPNLLPGRSPLFSGAGVGSTADGTDSDGYRVANAVFAVGVVVALAGIGYAVAVPQPGEQFTEVYLLDEDENGTLVADDYPEFAEGEPASVAVGVENHEGERTSYTVVAQLQRVEGTDDGVAVRDATEVHRSEVTLGDGERENVTVEFTPEETEDARLHVMVFDGPAPEDPTAASAYRNVTLRLDAIHGETED